MICLLDFWFQRNISVQTKLNGKIIILYLIKYTKARMCQFVIGNPAPVYEIQNVTFGFTPKPQKQTK